jgi:TetR/AcrR family transcriptional regulator, transcriptional repressor for nem operon
MPREPNPETKEKLLAAAEELMLRCGYTATSVDEICEAAGVTKGGFFHYFGSKHEVAVAALRRFFAGQAAVFAQAPYRKLADPLQRVYGYLDFLKQMAQTPAGRRGCLVGTLAQELAVSDKEIRGECANCFEIAAEDLRKDIAAAKSKYCPHARWTPQSLAEHCLAVLQGSLILVKAGGDTTVLLENTQHLKRYLQLLIEGEGK